MIARTIQLGMIIVGGFLLHGGPLRAQPQGDAGEAETAQDPPKSGSSAKSSRSLSTVAKDAKLSLEKIRLGAAQIVQSLQAAREDKDVVKMLCLSDKLDQMNVATSSAADRVAGIDAALSSGNKERATHDDAVLGALSVRAAELSVEANQCIGVEQGELGGSKLKISIDPEIPLGDIASMKEPGVNSGNLPSVPSRPERAPFEPPLDWIGELPVPISPTS